MLFGTLKNNNIIQVEDTEPDIFRDFIIFLYSPSEDLITQQNAIGLMHLASKYNIKDLLKFCEKCLANNLDFKNVALMLNTSVSIDCPHLRSKIFEFIIKNQCHLFPSKYFDDCNPESFKLMLPYLSVSEDEIFVVLRKWIKTQLKKKGMPWDPTNMRNAMEPFLNCIRLQSLSTENCEYLLQSDFCSLEVKKEIRQYMENEESIFFSKYFSTIPRFSPFETLQYETIWFSKETIDFNFSSDEYVDMRICAFYVKINSDALHYVKLQNRKSSKHLHVETFELPKMNPGYYMCFLPNDGFIINDKGSLQISQEQLSEEIKSGITWVDIKAYLPKICSFSNYNERDVNIDRCFEAGKEGDKAYFLGCSYTW